MGSGSDDNPLTEKFGDYSMYPCEGAEAPRKMSEWEILHCPWYLDSDKWSATFNSAEEAALYMINLGYTPNVHISESKMAPTEAEFTGCRAKEQACLGVAPSIDRSRSRKPKKEVGKEASKDVSQVSGMQSKSCFC